MLFPEYLAGSNRLHWSRISSTPRKNFSAARTYFSFFPLLFALAQRARTACRAISLRRSGESFDALIFPPLEPPSLPKATAAGFFFFSIVPKN